MNGASVVVNLFALAHIRLAAAYAGLRDREEGQGMTEYAVLVGAIVAMVLVVVASVARSATQAAAIATVGNGGSRAGWIAAAALDPGSYRINLRVAQLYAGRDRCSTARMYASRARGLFPSAPGARQLLQRCR